MTKVKFTVYVKLSSIPEEYWCEDLTKLDNHYTGEIIGNESGLLNSYVLVACNDKKIRKVNINDIQII